MKKVLVLAAILIGSIVHAQSNSYGDDRPAIDRLFEFYEGKDSVLVKNEKGQFWVELHRQYNREGQPLSMTADLESENIPALAELVVDLYHKRISEGFEAEMNHPYTEKMLEREMMDGWITEITFTRGTEHFVVKGQRDWNEPSTMMSIYEIHITYIDWDRRSGERITEFDF